MIYTYIKGLYNTSHFGLKCRKTNGVCYTLVPVEACIIHKTYPWNLYGYQYEYTFNIEDDFIIGWKQYTIHIYSNNICQIKRIEIQFHVIWFVNATSNYIPQYVCPWLSYPLLTHKSSYDPIVTGKLSWINCVNKRHGFVRTDNVNKTQYEQHVHILCIYTTCGGLQLTDEFDTCVRLCIFQLCVGAFWVAVVQYWHAANAYPFILFWSISLPMVSRYVTVGTSVCGFIPIPVHQWKQQQRIHRTQQHIDRAIEWTTIMLSLIAWFMGPTWGPPGDDRTQVGPMWAPWKLLTGIYHFSKVTVSRLKTDHP